MIDIESFFEFLYQENLLKIVLLKEILRSLKSALRKAFPRTVSELERRSQPMHVCDVTSDKQAQRFVIVSSRYTFLLLPEYISLATTLY